MELIKALRDSRFVQQVIARIVVEVVLILFDVGYPALQIGQAFPTLRGREILKLAVNLLEFLQASQKRFVNCTRGTSEPSLENGSGKCDAAFSKRCVRSTFQGNPSRMRLATVPSPIPG